MGIYVCENNNPNVKEFHMQHPLDMICKLCSLKKKNLPINGPTGRFILHRLYREIHLKRTNQGAGAYWGTIRGKKG